MGIPLYLAMTAAEMLTSPNIPMHCGWMACQFSPYSEGISNIPTKLPPNSMVILNDRFPCQGHSPGLVADQLLHVVKTFSCAYALLDFQRPVTPETLAIAQSVTAALPCPVGVSAPYSRELDCSVFLPPCPLHQPLDAYLKPWKGRELWLEAGLFEQIHTVTKSGSAFSHQIPPCPPPAGFFDESLCCQYCTEIQENQIRFTLWDTPQTLLQKLEKADHLGVCLAVGLYQELGQFQNDCPPVDGMIPESGETQ